MAKTFADEIVELSNTTGTGTYTLEGPKGSYNPFSASFATGEKPAYVVRNRTNTKHEYNRPSTLTIGPPDTLARSVWKSTNGNAAVSWTSDDLPLTITIPSSGEVHEGVVTGWLAAARHALLRAGASFWTYADIAVRWRRQIATGDAAQVDDGVYDVAKTIWVGYQNAPTRDTGTSNSTIATSAAASDRGYIVSHNTAAAVRTATLPAVATAGEGFYVGIRAAGIFPVLILTNSSQAIDCCIVPPGHIVWLRCDGSRWLVEPVAHHVLGQRRQTVISGPLSSGAPSFLPASESGLQVTTQNISTTAPIILRASCGAYERWGMIITNQQFTGLTNTATNYLYFVINVDGTVNVGKTTLAPVYQESGTPATTSGQYTFNYGEMKGYLGNGSTADEVYIVFLGEAVTSGGNVTSTVAYGYNGRYESGWTATLPVGGTEVSHNHNLGTHPKFADWIIECTTTDLGYAVGERISINGQSQGDNGAGFRMNTLSCTTKAMHHIGPGNSWQFLHKTTGALTSVTRANWKYRAFADRGWG